ncbi:hypothetical protein OBV_21080 [Oscillibacter valericigenes Sjm18-20]|nr:hypothetical protein OBV_21080 [Oscillibacter valericigenes Sjm18-20]
MYGKLVVWYWIPSAISLEYKPNQTKGLTASFTFTTISASRKTGVAPLTLRHSS